MIGGERAFAHVFLLRQLIWRDFQARYSGSLFGLVWSFVQPLWQLLLFSFVFSLVLRISAQGAGTNRFWVFLFCGLLPWLAVQEGISRGATAITDNAHLVKKLRFPSEVLVATVVVTALIHEAIAGVVFVLVLTTVGELSWRTLPWLLLALPLQVTLTCGIGLLLATVQVFFRDTTQLLTMALSAWFYLTPIVYPFSMVPARLQPWLALNPLTGLVSLYRAALLGGGIQSAQGIASLAISAATLLVGGWLLFRRVKPAFADAI